MKRILIAAVSVLGVLLAACGGDDSGTSADSTAAATTAAAAATESAYPITIEHRYGTTTFDKAPERIVSIDDQWTDVLVAMDGPLVAHVQSPLADGGRLPWQDVIPSTVESIASGNTIPFEAIAAAKPDLIVITYFAPDQQTYDQLNAIAPTIGLLGDNEVDQWQEIATTAGTILNDPDAAAQLIADAEANSAAVKAQLPGLEGLDYALANYVPGDAIYVVADPNDGASQLFAQLGMSIDPELLELADGAAGRAQLSLEQIGMLDSDVLILLTNGAEPADIPGYDALPAVKSGAVAILDVPTVSGLNTPSPLSVPYSLEAIKPALEAAHAAAGG